MYHWSTSSNKLYKRLFIIFQNTAVLARQVELFPPQDTKAGAVVSSAMSSANKDEKCVGNAAFKFLCQIIGEANFVVRLTFTKQ